MGISAISHTHDENGHHFLGENDISVVTKHQIYGWATYPELRGCFDFCSSLAVHDNPTDLPCLGLLFFDIGDPNCFVFVEHDSTPEEKTEPVDGTHPVHETPSVQQSRPINRTAARLLLVYIAFVGSFGGVFALVDAIYYILRAPPPHMVPGTNVFCIIQGAIAFLAFTTTLPDADSIEPLLVATGTDGTEAFCMCSLWGAFVVLFIWVERALAERVAKERGWVEKWRAREERAAKWRALRALRVLRRSGVENWIDTKEVEKGLSEEQEGILVEKGE